MIFATYDHHPTYRLNRDRNAKAVRVIRGSSLAPQGVRRFDDRGRLSQRALHEEVRNAIKV